VIISNLERKVETVFEGKGACRIPVGSIRYENALKCIERKGELS